MGHLHPCAAATDEEGKKHTIFSVTGLLVVIIENIIQTSKFIFIYGIGQQNLWDSEHFLWETGP